MAHLVPDHDEATVVDIGQRTNQYRIDGAEHGGSAAAEESEQRPPFAAALHIGLAPCARFRQNAPLTLTFPSGWCRP